MMIDKKIAPCLALLLALSLAGCGVELVGGGQGEVETVVTDGDTSDSNAPARSPSGGGAFQRSVQLSSLATGRVEADLSVALVDAGGGVTRVTESITGAEVGIAVDDSLRIGIAELEPRRFEAVRLTFTRVEAQLTTGLGIGGDPPVGTVSVDLGSAPLVIDVPVEVVVREGLRTKIVVDLKSRRWLLFATAAGQVVPAAAFESAVEVRVIQGGSAS